MSPDNPFAGLLKTKTDNEVKLRDEFEEGFRYFQIGILSWRNHPRLDVFADRKEFDINDPVFGESFQATLNMMAESAPSGLNNSPGFMETHMTEKASSLESVIGVRVEFVEHWYQHDNPNTGIKFPQYGLLMRKVVPTLTSYEKTLSLDALVKRIKEKGIDDETQELVSELASRASVAYLEHADKEAQEFRNASVPNPFFKEDDNRLVGWYPPSMLQHVKHHAFILAYFPYDKNDTWCCFDSNKHIQEYQNLSSYATKQGGYYVLVMKNYLSYNAAAAPHTGTGDFSVEIDITKATRFTVFASTACDFTKEGLMRRVVENKRQITELQQTLRVKNTELDALGYVWCSGPCRSGQFRYTEPKEITAEFIKHAKTVVARLEARGPTKPVNTKQEGE